MAPRVKLQNVGEAAASVDEETQVASAPAVETAPASEQVENEVTREGNGDNGEANGEGEAASNLEAERKKYMRLVGQIGGEYGTGKRALVDLAKTVIEAAEQQVIKAGAKVATPKDGKKKLDDAAMLYGRFRGGADKKAGTATDAELAASANDGSYKAQVSKLRSLIKFGNEYRDDASQIAELAIEVHGDLLKNPADRKQLKLTSTYSALVGVAREQLKEARKGQPMTAEELRDLFLGEEKAPKDGADLILDAMSTLRRAQKGKDATDENPGREGITDPGVEDALLSLRDVLSRISPEKHRAMVEKEAAEAAEAAKTAEDEGDEDGETE